MVVTGYFLAVIGFIACLVGEIRMLVLAYRRGFGWLLACLILAPLCWIALLMVDFKPVVRPFILAVVGMIVYWIGASMANLISK